MDAPEDPGPSREKPKSVYTRIDYKKIAAIAIEAMEMDMRPVKTLAELLGVSNVYASKLHRAAMSKGLLGVPPHHPFRAQMRHPPHQQSWLACGECLVHWPCRHAFPDETRNGSEPFDDRPDAAAARRRRHFGTAGRRSRTKP